MRFGAEFQDLDDIRHLLGHLTLTDVDEVLAIVLRSYGGVDPRSVSGAEALAAAPRRRVTTVLAGSSRQLSRELAGQDRARRGAAIMERLG